MPRVSDDHLTARREQILAAARHCFLTKGLHATSMQDLVREADLSTGAVYRYFKSKNEIISAIAEKVLAGLTAYLEEIIRREQALPLLDVMSLVLDAVDVQLGPDGNFPLALQVWAEATLDPSIAAIVQVRYAGIRGTFATIVRRAVERGELPPDTDIEATATALYGTVPGYAVQHVLMGNLDKQTYLRGLDALFNRR